MQVCALCQARRRCQEGRWRRHRVGASAIARQLPQHASTARHTAALVCDTHAMFPGPCRAGGGWGLVAPLPGHPAPPGRASAAPRRRSVHPPPPAAAAPAARFGGPPCAPGLGCGRLPVPHCQCRDAFQAAGAGRQVSCRCCAAGSCKRPLPRRTPLPALRRSSQVLQHAMYCMQAVLQPAERQAWKHRSAQVESGPVLCSGVRRNSVPGSTGARGAPDRTSWLAVALSRCCVRLLLTVLRGLGLHVGGYCASLFH